MIRILPAVIEGVLLVFGLVDCLMADGKRIRNLPRWGWLLLIVVVPFIGCLIWLWAGRPRRESPASPPTPTWERPPYERPLPPDDDPEFIAKLKRTNIEHERTLKRWEEDLRRRDEELRRQQETDDTGPEPDR